MWRILEPCFLNFHADEKYPSNVAYLEFYQKLHLIFRKKFCKFQKSSRYQNFVVTNEKRTPYNFGGPQPQVLHRLPVVYTGFWAWGGGPDSNGPVWGGYFFHWRKQKFRVFANSKIFKKC